MGYKAPRLDELGLEIPSHLKDYHKNHHGLAEIHDLPCLADANKYQLVKSVELHQLPEYIEAFPSVTFLLCVRPAGETLASVADYFMASGLRWPYNPEEDGSTWKVPVYKRYRPSRMGVGSRSDEDLHYS